MSTAKNESIPADAVAPSGNHFETHLTGTSPNQAAGPLSKYVDD